MCANSVEHFHCLKCRSPLCVSGGGAILGVLVLARTFYVCSIKRQLAGDGDHDVHLIRGQALKRQWCKLLPTLGTS